MHFQMSYSFFSPAVAIALQSEIGIQGVSHLGRCDVLTVARGVPVTGPRACRRVLMGGGGGLGTVVRLHPYRAASSGVRVHGPNDHRLVAPLVAMEDRARELENPPAPFIRGPLWSREAAAVASSWMSGLRLLLRASPAADIEAECARLRAIVDAVDQDAGASGWRECALCSEEVAGYAEVVLDRRCGHQAHIACLRRWWRQLFQEGAGVLCPGGCGWAMGSFDLLAEVPTRGLSADEQELVESLRRTEVPRLAGPMGRTGTADFRPPAGGDRQGMSGPLLEAVESPLSDEEADLLALLL